MVSFQEIRSQCPLTSSCKSPRRSRSSSFPFQGALVVQKYVVQQSFVGLLYENGAFVRVLEPGTHEFAKPWFSKPVERRVEMIEIRERSLTIKGQEILTKDKVAI